MEGVKVESPFRSPLNNFPSRSRAGSGSSSSSGKQSPAHQTPTNGCSHNYQSGHSSSGGDENDPLAGSGISSSNNGGDSTRINPFEKDVLAGLHRSFWSPSIMEIHETPPQRSWAIEHLAHLFPKDFENSPSTHQNTLPVDAQTEAKAQADIDAYFSRGQIVPTPSPMKGINHIQYTEPPRFSKGTIPFNQIGQSPIARGGGVGLSNGVMKKKKLGPVIEKWTQTTLSLPPELPLQVEEVLSQYFQLGDLCGTFGEASASCSQRSEASEHTDGVDNDSGKNSSLNTSIRRRLDLSFGDDESNEFATAASPIPVVDPFRRNHMISTPPNSSVIGINTTTTELEIQLMRCEFTPEARGTILAITPGITPIQDESERSSSCSTPRRNNANSKRWVKDDFLYPVSPMEEFPASHVTPKAGGSNENMQVNLRRCRVATPKEHKKTGSALSFDENQLMEGCSPPAKLCRRSLENDNS
ncbi:unnamed protein product [Orchesella dallaii]|uniref:Protein aurora borealis n=1 Tax=Orchesella dallaii TaxID=48710 RepID=A0ABP1PPH0_9HEXA